MRRAPVILPVLFLFFIISSCNQPTVISYESDPIDASMDPIQESLNEDHSFSLQKGGNQFDLKPVARYLVSARVMSTRSYSSGWESSLSPVDLVLVWGDLADKKYDRNISYRQRNRWYYYRYSADFPLSTQYIINHSCNNHMVPATDNIRRALKSIKTDDLITVQGYLINITGKMGGRKVWWNTSTSRSDSGDHSCEIIYVEKLRVRDKVYL
jgi:hypothetical protein